MKLTRRKRKIISSVQPSQTTTPPTEQAHFAGVRRQVEQFDEEKKGALERPMVFLFTIAAYVGRITRRPGRRPGDRRYL